MRGLPQSTIIPQKCQLAGHTERLLDRSVFISTVETKRITNKKTYVAAKLHTDLNLITTLTKSLLITRDKRLSRENNNARNRNIFLRQLTLILIIENR